jgi:hypothetical protein
VGILSELETQMTQWVPSDPKAKSPDRCVAKGTLIATINGDVPIEDIHVGDLVLTRSGYRKVLASTLTERNADVLRLTLSSGKILDCTPNHPIWVEDRGKVPAWTLSKRDRLVALEFRSLSSTAKSTGAILTAKASQQPVISTTTQTNAEKAVTHFIKTFGNSIVGQFLKNATYTTGTWLSTITASKIWNWLLGKNTLNDTENSIFRPIGNEWSITVAWQ